MKKNKILVLDDDPGVRESLAEYLEKKGYISITASTGKEALIKLKKEAPLVALIDLRLGNMFGLEVMKEIKKLSPRTECIVFTGYASQKSAIEAIHLGAFDYLEKPYNLDQLLLTVKRAIEKRKAEAALQKAYADLEREVEKRTAELKKANEKLQAEIAERKKAEEESRKLAKEWETTFNSISDMATIIDKNYELTQINRTCSNAFKMEPKELIGMKCYEVFHGAKAPPNDCLFNQAMKNKIPVIREFFEPHLGIYLEITISPIVKKGRAIGAIHIAKDISIRKRTEEQLFHSERMAGIGELAAGIAHEIRNPLGNISASAQLCLSKQMQSEQFKKHMRLILRNSRSANKIIQDLLNFARPSEMIFNPGQISTVITRVCSLAKARCIKQNVRLSKRVSRRMPKIMMDEKRLEQVFLNFIINSLDSMGTGGRLFISAYPEEKEMIVRFLDTGVGIPDKDMDKIFDPFFTRKKNGVGLGLSLSHQIISFHKGSIKIKSTLDQGTEVTVRFPIPEVG